MRFGDFLPAGELFLGGQRVDLGQLPIDGRLQFKVENHAVDLLLLDCCGFFQQGQFSWCDCRVQLEHEPPPEATLDR